MDLVKNSNLSQVQVAIIAFLFSKPAAKHSDIAKETGQSVMAIRALMSDPNFKKVYQNAVLSHSHNRFLEVVDKVTEQAIDGKASQQKLYFQINEVLFDQSQKYRTPEAPITKDPDELINNKKRVEAELIELIKEETEGGIIKKNITFDRNNDSDLSFEDTHV